MLCNAELQAVQCGTVVMHGFCVFTCLGEDRGQNAASLQVSSFNTVCVVSHIWQLESCSRLHLSNCFFRKSRCCGLHEFLPGAWNFEYDWIQNVSSVYEWISFSRFMRYHIEKYSFLLQSGGVRSISIFFFKLKVFLKSPWHLKQLLVYLWSL